MLVSHCYYCYYYYYCYYFKKQIHCKVLLPLHLPSARPTHFSLELCSGTGGQTQNVWLSPEDNVGNTNHFSVSLARENHNDTLHIVLARSVLALALFLQGHLLHCSHLVGILGPMRWGRQTGNSNEWSSMSIVHQRTGDRRPCPGC